MNVTDAIALFHCWTGGQPLPVNEALTRIGIDGEIAGLKRSEVLEEVAALEYHQPAGRNLYCAMAASIRSMRTMTVRSKVRDWIHYRVLVMAVRLSP